MKVLSSYKLNLPYPFTLYSYKQYLPIPCFVHWLEAEAPVFRDRTLVPGFSELNPHHLSLCEKNFKRMKLFNDPGECPDPGFLSRNSVFFGIQNEILDLVFTRFLEYLSIIFWFILKLFQQRYSHVIFTLKNLLKNKLSSPPDVWKILSLSIGV